MSWWMVPNTCELSNELRGAGARILLLSSHLTAAAAAHMTKQQLPHTCSTPAEAVPRGHRTGLGGRAAELICDQLLAQLTCRPLPADLWCYCGLHPQYTVKSLCC